MNKWLLIGVAVFAFFYLMPKKESLSEQNNNLIKAQLAHALALTDSQTKPIDKDDDKIPSLADCPLCKGTKIQIHADGHKTPCPYHGTTTEELLQKHMDLSELIAEMQEEDKAFKIQMANKLDEIDIAHKQPNPPIIKPIPNHPYTVAPQVVSNNCPCGCKHTVANCNCRSTCPGKQLPAYTYVANKPVMRKKIVCSNGSCYETYEAVPQQITTKTTVKQSVSPVISGPIATWNQKRIKLLPWRR